LLSKLSLTHKKVITQTINTLTKIIEDKSITNKLELPILYPFEPNHFITEILEITEFQSNSKPLLIKVIVQKLSNKKIGKKMGKKMEKKFIIKKDNYLRKENIVSSLIILLQDKLIQQAKRGIIDDFEPIPTYKIIMLNNQIGIIEFLDNCLTLKNISLKNYTLQNFILENNKDTKIGVIKERFAKSLAISSCLSYVLGLGDRHAQNIMVSNNGQIIHIDYGYILENPIHSNIVNNPVIRISTEMIDFLGGWNSEYYNMFKNYTIHVFDIFRLNSNIIINFYNILGYEKIMDWNKLKKRLTDRFMNGLAFKDIEVVLLDVIESSTKSYGGTFIDLCNEYGSKIKGWI
jgi:phosphatidylinositol kinase/protein kinase (PI-3  family)